MPLIRSIRPRVRRVVQIAAEKSGWGKRQVGNGTGMGIAVHRSFLTYVATVVEVEVDAQGKLKIPCVHTAVDAGSGSQSGSRPRPVRGRGGVRNQPRSQRRNHRHQRGNRSVKFLRLSRCSDAGGSATRPMFTWWTATLRPQGLASPAFPRLCRRSAMRYLPRPEEEFESCLFPGGWPGPRAASTENVDLFQPRVGMCKALIAMSVNRRRPGFSQPLLL